MRNRESLNWDEIEVDAHLICRYQRCSEWRREVLEGDPTEKKLIANTESDSLTDHL